MLIFEKFQIIIVSHVFSFIQINPELETVPDAFLRTIADEFNLNQEL